MTAHNNRDRVCRYMSTLEQRLDRVESSLRATNDLLARVPRELLRDSAEDGSDEVGIDNGDVENEADGGTGNVDAMGAVIFADETESGYFGNVSVPCSV